MKKVGEYFGFPRKISGGVLLALGAWMIISPQAQLVLKGLSWVQNYVFPGEAFFGVLITPNLLECLMRRSCRKLPM